MQQPAPLAPGFTLVEMLISLALVGVVTSAVFGFFLSNQKTYALQGQVVEMQQSLRFGLDLITTEIRMAGFDPKGTSGATIHIAQPDFLYFSQDLDGDGHTDGEGEHVAFCLYVDSKKKPSLGRTTGDATDSDGDGTPDVGEVHPLHNHGKNSHQPIGRNIERIEFLYTLADGSKTFLPAKTEEIRAVTVSLLARTDHADPHRGSARKFPTPSGAFWSMPGDGFRRRFLSETIQCRNMGL